MAKGALLSNSLLFLWKDF